MSRADPSPRTGNVRRAALLLLALLILFAVGSSLLASSDSPRAILVEAHGGTFVGGRTVSIEGRQPRARASAVPGRSTPLVLEGQYVRGATYVEYTMLARPVGPPIVMFPGGGLSSASFQDTPDGRPGWEAFFLRRGHSVSLVDVDRTGRSPWRTFPEIDPEEPSFRNHAFLWETFRVGPPGSYARRQAYRDSRFPLESFDAFAGQTGPRFRPDPEEQASAYDAVIRRFCPCILLLHSASGAPGMAAAQRTPGLVRAVVAIEPSAAPAVANLFRHMPHVFVWGDHLRPNETDPGWSRQYRTAQAYAARLRSAGVRVEWIDLPARGIRGNSHLPMMDRNSDEVARVIAEGLDAAASGSPRTTWK